MIQNSAVNYTAIEIYCLNLDSIREFTKGKIGIKEFRDWHVSRLLTRDQFTDSDQTILFAIECAYGDLLMGASLETFRDSLQAILRDYEPAP